MDEHIIESEDGKLWYGGGAWTDQRDRAKKYASEMAARAEIDKFAMKGKAVPFATPSPKNGGEGNGGNDGMN